MVDEDIRQRHLTQKEPDEENEKETPEEKPEVAPEVKPKGKLINKRYFPGYIIL